MKSEEFLKRLQEELSSFENAISTNEKEWVIKGFIDVYKNIYTISLDTKIISKVLELLLFPLMQNFAKENNLELELSPEQNFYPDLTFIDKSDNSLFAVDIKSTYRTDVHKVNGMTLGAFTGYFRNRESKKNIAHPYKDYSWHIVLGVIYSQASKNIDERKIYSISDLKKIPSVIRDFKFFAQPKYKIAAARPGSGNTKNIGSVTDIEKLLNGKGPFSELGESVFDDYWEFYLTSDMAASLEISRPYTNLKEYFEYKNRNAETLNRNKDKIEKLEDE